MAEQIKYVATLDTNPFAAASKRLTDVLRGVQGQSESMRSVFAAQTDAMRAQMRGVTENMRAEMVAMGGHFGGLLESVSATRAGFVALTAAAAGLAASKAAAFSAQLTESTMDLARAMGSSTNEASRWREALADVGATQSEAEGAARGLAKQLRENEERMNALGLKTRDAAGNFRPMSDLLVDGIAIVNEYKQGVDQAMVSKELFGKAVDASSKMLLINRDVLAEADAGMKEFGLEVGENAVRAWKDYDAASDKAAQGLRGIGNTVGAIVMPVITDLINAFNSLLPSAITVVRGALGGLATAFHLVKNGVVAVWEVTNAMVISVAEPLRALVEGLGRAMTGDFAGAASVIRGVPATISAAWKTALVEIADSSEKTRERISAIWSPDSAAGKPIGASGSKRFTPGPAGSESPESEKEKRPTDPMATYEAVLAEESRAQALLEAGREYTKEQEVNFWRAILDTYEPGAKARTAIVRKMADLEVAILREKAKQREQLDILGLKAQQDRALAAVELAQMDAQAQLAAGDSTKAQALEADRQFEEQRLAIKLDYLRARMAMVDPERDPVAYEQASLAIEEAERAHRQRMQQIKIEANQNERDNNPMLNVWKSTVDAMSQAAGQILTRQQSLAAGLKNIWQGIRQSIANELSKIIAAKVMAYARERVLALAGIGVKAAEAGAGAAASQAAIPIVGPSMALAAMAATAAAVMGLGASLPSAARGWDIPSGINPIAQLHEQEMVLPAEQAQVIRDMASGNATTSQPAAVLRTVGTMGDFLMVHRHDLAKVLKVINRDSLRG